MFPVFLNLCNRLALIVGAGPVGRRRMCSLLDAGARVRVVSLEPSPDEESVSDLQWVTSPFEPAHLEGVALAFACAPEQVNVQVVEACKQARILVCSASDPEEGDFHTPALVRRGDLLLAIGTGGASPLLARRIRRKLEAMFDEAWSEWLAILKDLRPLIAERYPDSIQRRQMQESLCDVSWLRQLRRQGATAVRAAMQALVEG